MNRLLVGMVTLLGVTASAQSVLFDFDNAPLHAPLPIDVTAGGITAHLSATGSGFSIQDTSVPIVPSGFSGRFLYPSSVFAADLIVDFSQTLTGFSILYAPEELGCDDSATMRVTAYRNGAFVGTNTTTAKHPGTWPSETLGCAFATGFDRVVVHYDAKPPTCQEWGPIFMADDMSVTPAAPAGFTPYGGGCQGSAGVPSLAAMPGSLPWIGYPFTAVLGNLGSDPAVHVPLLWLGSSNSSWSGNPLPLDLGFAGMPGCALLASIDIGFPLQNAAGSATWSIQVPAIASFVGVSLYVQGAATDPGSNPLGVVVSNACEMQIGIR